MANPSLVGDYLRLGQYRQANPQLSDLSDTDLAKLVNQDQPEELGTLAKSSTIGRLFAKGDMALKHYGQVSTETLQQILGQSRPARIVSRAAGMAVEQAPEIAMNLLAGRIMPRSKAVGGALVGGSLLSSYGRTAVETGSQEEALKATAGNLVTMGGSMLGGAKGRKMGGPAGGAAGSFLGALTGQMGSEAVLHPDQFKEMVHDPVELGANVLSQIPYAAMDYVTMKGEAAKFNSEKRRADTQSLEEFTGRTKEQEYTDLRNTPVAQLSEIQIRRRHELATELAKADEVSLRAPKLNPPDVTLRSKIFLLNHDKLPAVFIPKDTEVPTIPSYFQGFLEHERPEGLYLYNPDQTKPEQIDLAVKNNTIGTLLGYGTSALPKDLNGFTLTLRTEHGTEKFSVPISDQTEDTVLTQLKKLAEPTDTITRDNTESLAAERQKRKGLIRLYSIQSDRQLYSRALAPGSFSSLYEEFFRSKYDTESGLYVRDPAFLKNDGQREHLVNPPDDFVDFLQKKGIQLDDYQYDKVHVRQYDLENAGFKTEQEANAFYEKERLQPIEETFDEYLARRYCSGLSGSNFSLR